MTTWDYESLTKMIDAFINEGDRTDPKERKRTRIVEAAGELFLKHGYRKTSIDEVARRAGVAKGTVYLYFENKADLLMHVIAREKRRYFADIKPVFDSGLSPQDRLKLWIRKALMFSTKMPIVSKLIGGDRELLLALQEIDQGQKQEWETIASQFLGQMIDEAAAPNRWTASELTDRSAVLQAIAYFSSLIEDERIRGGLALDRFAEILADMMVDGISASDGRVAAKKKLEGGSE